MPYVLSPESFNEMSMVFAKKDGKDWSPRNQSARVLATKGAADRSVEIAGKPVKINKAAPAFIEALAPSADEATLEEYRAKGWLLPDETPDNIDDDGDGAEDYEKIVSLLMGTYYDLSSAMQIGGESARGAAITTTIDTFRKNFEDVCGGGEGDVAKSGARHSKADQGHIDAIAGHADKMKKALNTFGKHADAIKGHTDALQPTAPDDSANGDPDGDGDGDSNKGGTVNDSTENVTRALSPDPEVDALKAELQSYKSEFDAYRLEMDARLAVAHTETKTAIETATAEQVEATTSALERSKAAVLAARAPTAGGALAVMDDSFRTKTAPAVHQPPEKPIQINRETSTPMDVIRAARQKNLAAIDGAT